jgi:tRNA threonylcarbamoyl adenosine modification protein YeaZ
MLVLAIDTSSEAVSACVFDAQTMDPVASETMPLSRGHAEALIPLIDRVVYDSGLSLDDMDRIAVTVGPGSFTGVRIGIAAARAIGLAIDADVVGVCTLSAFAVPYIGEPVGEIASVVDARHDRVYFQLFDWRGGTIIPPTLMTITDAARQFSSSTVILAGTGAALIAEEAWKRGIITEGLKETFAPDIVCVAQLGAFADPLDDLPKPLYLKAPDVTLAAGAR